MGVPNSLRAMHGEYKGKMTKTNLFMADLDLIEEEDGFNTREYDRPEVKEHIRKLADVYKAGEELPPLLVRVVDGRILLRDGYCRRRGALLAREEGAEIVRLPIQEVKGDEVEQSMVILTSNDGLKLTALERAKVYARLLGMNLTEDEIASRVRKTKTHVQQYLAVYGLPVKLKEYIKADVVSWSLALEMYNEHGSKAVDLLDSQHSENQAAADASPEANKNAVTPNDGESTVQPAALAKPKRITRKSIDAATGYRSRLTGTMVKSVTDRIGSVVKSLSEAEEVGDHVMVRMSKEEADALRALHQEILPPAKKNKDAPDSSDGDSSSEHSQCTDTEHDNLYEDAVTIVKETGKATVSSLQRKLRVGYNHAARLIESMERSGIVSSADDTGNREVLVGAN